MSIGKILNHVNGQNSERNLRFSVQVLNIFVILGFGVILGRINFVIFNSIQFNSMGWRITESDEFATLEYRWWIRHFQPAYNTEGAELDLSKAQASIH